MAMPRVAHVQVPSDEGEEMLLEVETLNTVKPRHWYFAGAGLALLVVLGVAAKVLYRSPETSLKTKDFDINTIQEWEQIPGIDTVVEHAKTLELKQPLRNLNDLFYESQPEELPWIRTECVIDVIQGAAYLGQAVVFLYKAIKYDGIRCPNNSEAGCAASIAGFITSATNSASVYTSNLFCFWFARPGGASILYPTMAPEPRAKTFQLFSLFFGGVGGVQGNKLSKVTWIASYLSFAANACGAAVNSGALCAGDWTALMANFGEMATVGAAVKEDCDFGKDWLAILKITGTGDAGLLKRSVKPVHSQTHTLTFL